jgi:hypothetical protein
VKEKFPGGNGLPVNVELDVGKGSSWLKSAEQGAYSSKSVLAMKQQKTQVGIGSTAFKISRKRPSSRSNSARST